MLIELHKLILWLNVSQMQLAVSALKDILTYLPVYAAPTSK